MYTSIVLAALMSPGAAAPQALSAETPTWQENYAAARKVGQQQNKPLAVFIGSGENGWQTLTKESKLSADAQKMLADSYVALYVDAGSPAGKRLAEQFALTQGLVVSSRDGKIQAFRHSGQIAGKTLESTLKRYSNGYVSLRTESLDEEEEGDKPKDKPKDKEKPKDKPAPPHHHPGVICCYPGPVVYSSYVGCYGGFGCCGSACCGGRRCR